jgi:hypothetical protein
MLSTLQPDGAATKSHAADRPSGIRPTALHARSDIACLHRYGSTGTSSLASNCLALALVVNGNTGGCSLALVPIGLAITAADGFEDLWAKLGLLLAYALGVRDATLSFTQIAVFTFVTLEATDASASLGFFFLALALVVNGNTGGCSLALVPIGLAITAADGFELSGASSWLVLTNPLGVCNLTLTYPQVTILAFTTGQTLDPTTNLFLTSRRFSWGLFIAASRYQNGEKKAGNHKTFAGHFILPCIHLAQIAIKV